MFLFEENRSLQGTVRVCCLLQPSFQHLEKLKLNSIQVGGSLTFH